MSPRRRSRARKLDGFASRSPAHAAVVSVIRFGLAVAFVLVVFYGLLAASPLIGQLLAGAMLHSNR